MEESMHKMLAKCPNCGGDLECTRLTCTNCETVILARYAPCSFCKLSADSLHFIEVFVKNRGNLKEMEREVGQSYWGLRARLNEVIAELGFEVSTEAPGLSDEELAQRRREILERIDRGEIKAEEAAQLLSALRREGR
jgi:hypothetical protein